MQYPTIKLGYAAESHVFSRHRMEPIRPINFYDEQEDEDEEEYTMNGNDHVNYVNNFHPSTALASTLMNGDHLDPHAIPIGLINGEEETLRMLEHGMVDGFVYQQHSALNTSLENGHMGSDIPEHVLDTAQFSHLPHGTEVIPGWIWTEKGLKRKRGRPRKGSAVFIDAEQLAKKQRKKRKKDEMNGIITQTQHRIIGYDGTQISGITSQAPLRIAGKRPAHPHPAPVTVVQLHPTDQQMVDVANEDHLEGEKGPEWEVLGHGEIGTMVEQIAQALEGTGEERSANNDKGHASAQDYTQYGVEMSYSDLVNTLGVEHRPQPNMEPAQSNTNVTVHKPIESVIASTLEQELNSNETTNTVMDISLDEAQQSTQPSAPVPIVQQLTNHNNAPELSSPENIMREIQAVLSPLPTTPAPSTPLPNTPLPNTSLPHTPMPVTPLPNVATPTDPQQPPRPQIDYINPPAPTPSHQQPLEDGEIVSTPPPSFQTPRTPQPRTPRSPLLTPTPHPVESSQERVSQTLVLDDEGEELVLPSALTGSSDSNAERRERSPSPPSARTQSRAGGISLPDDAARNREIESSNHLTSPSSDDTPRTPLNVLLARTEVYDNDSDIEVEEEPIALRRKRRTENKRRERSPSPPSARKRQRNNSNSTPTTNTNGGSITSTPATTNNNNNNLASNTNAVALPTEQPVGQLDMTAEQPRRRGRQRKDKNVNRFESVDGLIDLVDD